MEKRNCERADSIVIVRLVVSHVEFVKSEESAFCQRNVRCRGLNAVNSRFFATLRMTVTQCAKFTVTDHSLILCLIRNTNRIYILDWYYKSIHFYPSFICTESFNATRNCLVQLIRSSRAQTIMYNLGTYLPASYNALRFSDFSMAP